MGADPFAAAAQSAAGLQTTAQRRREPASARDSRGALHAEPSGGLCAAVHTPDSQPLTRSGRCEQLLARSLRTSAWVDQAAARLLVRPAEVRPQWWPLARSGAVCGEPGGATALWVEDGRRLVLGGEENFFGSNGLGSGRVPNPMGLPMFKK